MARPVAPPPGLDVNDLRATLRPVDGRRFTLLWLHTGTWGQTFEQIPMIDRHLHRLVRSSRRSEPTDADRSGTDPGRPSPHPADELVE